MTGIFRKSAVLMLCGMLMLSCPINAAANELIEVKTDEKTITIVVEEAEEIIDILEEQPQIQQASVSQSDIELLALLTMGEAEGESEYGQRLVIDTVLNRVDSSEFPNTIQGVIYEKGQYSSMSDGRMNQVYVSSNICQLVKEELANRTDNKVLYFRTGHYHSFGTPMFQVGHHYFSGK